MAQEFKNRLRIIGVPSEEEEEEIYGQSSPYERESFDIEGKDFLYDMKVQFQDYLGASGGKKIIDNKGVDECEDRNDFAPDSWWFTTFKTDGDLLMLRISWITLAFYRCLSRLRIKCKLSNLGFVGLISSFKTFDALITQFSVENSHFPLQ